MRAKGEEKANAQPMWGSQGHFIDDPCKQDSYSKNTVISSSSSKQNPSTKALIKEKNKARKRWQATWDPAHRAIYLNLQGKVNKALKSDSTENWNQFIHKIESSPKDFWRKTKPIRKKTERISSLVTNGKTLLTDKEIGNELAEHFSNQFSKEKEEDQPNITYNHQQEKMLTMTTPNEVKEVIKYLANHKAPGHDNITPQMAKNLPIKWIVFLAGVFNAALHLCYYPKVWKHAIIIPIPKKSAKSPEDLRPISLLSTIGKIYERIILRRLQMYLDNSNFIIPQQFGFRRGHSTTHQLIAVLDYIQIRRSHKEVVGAVFLDFAKAFDKVWHNGLIKKLTKHQFPIDIINFMQNYLQGRTFSVKQGNFITEPKPIQTGVPQGSILGPYLFNIYINDIPLHSKCKLKLFADDTAILFNSKSVNLLVTQLQNYLNDIIKWCDEWKLDINPTKTQAIVFPPRDNKKFKPQTNLTVNSSTISWADHAKYLGVTLDSKLKFNLHVQNTIRKAKIAKISLSSLLNFKSNLTTKHKFTLYKTCILPIITYALPVWGKYITPTDKKRIDAFMRICLRTTIGAPFNLSNKILKEDLNQPNIEEIYQDSATRLFSQFQKSSNPTIQEIVQNQDLRCDGSSLEFRMSEKPRVVGVTLMKGVDPASIKEDAGIVVSSEQMVEETSKQIAVEESKKVQVVNGHFAEDGEKAKVKKKSVVEVDESHRAEVEKESVEADEEKGLDVEQGMDSKNTEEVKLLYAEQGTDSKVAEKLDAEQGTDSKVAERQDADLENGKDSEAETKDNEVGDSKTAIEAYESVSNSKAVAEGADQVEISDGETESIDDIEERVVRVPASRKLVEARQTGDAEFKIKGCYLPDPPVFEYDTSGPSDDTSKPADDALASDPDSSEGKAQDSHEVPEIAVEDSDEKSAIENSQPSEPLDVEGSGVGASSDVEVRAQTKSPKAISSKILCMKKEESSIDLEEEDTGRNEPSPASITFKALETTDSKEFDLTILGNIAREHCAQGITFEQSNVIRTLGLGWIQSEDCFLYEVQSLEKTSATTTSKMLSFIAKLEDPLRWLAPVLVTGKIMVQRLWITGLHWDDPMDESLIETWTDFHRKFENTPMVGSRKEYPGSKIAWIRTMSGNLPTFIGNRVAEIQSCPQVREWRYVPTGDNPADIAKRGILGSELKPSSIWWTGPTWLSAESTEWPRMPSVFENQSQTELLSVHALSETPFLVAIGEMSSTFNGYIRKVAWILRFYQNCRYSAERYQSHLTPAELRNAHRRILQAIQCQHFREEMRSLTTLGSVKRTGKIYGLTPILDDQGILGVGGRLKWAPSMTYEQNHPALLPSSGKVAQMIVKAVHMRTLHGSVHLMLSTLRQKYWMLRAKDQVKRCIRECVTCCRYNRVTQGQLMSDLPKERLTPANDGTKWKTISPNVDINTLVLIKEERMPPAKWIVGRVVEKHPGKDGLVRVVSVRTSVGVLRRPLVKLVLLPMAPPELDVTHQLGEK
ncbi:hypothetical protein LAZ67_10003116, partial [Cordylochernes scorpioides]